MKKTISFKTKFGWISASEENNKILQSVQLKQSIEDIDIDVFL